MSDERDRPSADRPERDRQPERQPRPPREPGASRGEERSEPQIEPGNREPGNREPRERRDRTSSTKDLTPLLKGWDYEPGTINVRKIYGIDGTPKVQQRVELGLSQWLSHQ